MVNVIVKLNPKKYSFRTNIRWRRARSGVLSADDRTTIDVACPPEFGGELGYWTAEHLFVAATEICIMTTFIWLLEKAGGKLISYESEAVGTAQMINGDFRFSEIEIRPVVTTKEIYFSKAKDAMEKARKQCLISKALNFKVKVNSTIKKSVRKGRQ